MKQNIHDYFLLFFVPNHMYDYYDYEAYYKRDYITLAQLVMGILFSPFAIFLFILYKLATLKIHI